MIMCWCWMHYKETKHCWFQIVNATIDSREPRTESWLSLCFKMDEEWE